MIRVADGGDAGLARYLADIGHYPLLDREAELSLARRARAGDAVAAQCLVESNLRYVVKIAAQYRGYGLRFADLVEEGNVGLLEAVRRFEPERGHRFMTYGAFWVRACMLAYVLRSWSLVGVGSGPMRSKLFFRLQRERARLAASEGQSGEEAEAALAARFHTTAATVRDMGQRLDTRDLSLDAEAFREGGATGLDLLADETADPEARLAGGELSWRVRGRVGAAMGSLDGRERRIVERRLLADEPASLAALGRELGVTRERVRQLEVRVKTKLRSALADLAPP